MKKLIQVLLNLIDFARIFGLNEDDLKNAKDYLRYQEFGLCFDTIITQMYEYDIEIENDFYTLISKIGDKMKLENENYSFMKELIVNKSILTQAEQEQLAKIISGLNN
ncbi:MafI family immunity protein [Pedobacter sp. WC2501]|uniref:MafI family immunity protein n=1 Tax=Pedobacter sp. WC2501 TaxID=3461400 RepID=UPI00404634E0